MPPKNVPAAAATATNESSSLLETYRQQRTTTEANILKIKSNLEKKRGTLSGLDIEGWLELVNSYIKNLMTFQTDIERLDPTDDKRGDLEKLCISTNSLLKSMLGGTRRESFANQTLGGFTTNPHRLPALKIPKFSGKYAEYKNFISSFNSLVHNESNITKATIEKFNHLIACLTDDALRTVKAFQVTEENYQSALDRLADRFDNKCLIFQDHINALFNMEKIVKPSAAALRQVVDNVSAILDSLSHLGSDKDIMHALVIHLVMSKVDNTSRTKWDEGQDLKELPKWDACASVLIRRCQFLELNDDKKGSQEVTSNVHKNEKRNTRSSFSCTRAKTEGCLYCSKNGHTLENCREFCALPVPRRFSHVKKSGICINCLKKGHMVSRCNGPKCKICSRAHHELLHRYEASQPSLHANSAPQSVVQNGQQDMGNNRNTNRGDYVSANDGPHCSHAAANSVAPVLSHSIVGNAQSMHMSLHSHQMVLATAVVLVKNKFSQYYLARALLDSCSQVNLMTEDFAQKLNLKRERCSLNIIGVGGTNTPVKHKIGTFVKSRVANFEFFVDFCVVHTVSGNQPEYAISRDKFSIPSNIQLADPSFDRPEKIDLLLGCEYFLDLLSVGQIKLGPSLPTLQKTLLGWIVSGKCESDSPENVSKICNVVTESHYSDDTLDSVVRRFWELEEIPQRSLLTEEQKNCEEHYNANTLRLPNGRFQVKLPFKSNPSKLGLSYDTARRRFLALERKLGKNLNIKEMYNEFMREYLHLGHMSPVNDEVLFGPHYVIPHQCVLRPHSSTTKLRVVFDASCKTSTQISLNDILMVGPTIQSDLFSTLLRFRLHRYAITANVTKMYRQVLVHESDAKFQLVLWRESIEQPIQIYKLNTVTYGTSSAPFAAVRCLKEIGTLFESVYPLGSSTIINDFYVDDLLSGADNFEELEKLRFEVTEILKSCGFDLAKWFSNHPSYTDGLSEMNLDFDDWDVRRALGLIWSTGRDLFTFKLEDNFGHLPTTKRNILSISSRLFDPLGLLSPIIIRAKILLQELWKRKLDWDESVPQSVDTTWSQIKNSLADSHKIVIPRFVDSCSTVNCEVHGFSDASNNAYGCCIYIRTEHPDGITCRLLTAKSKVAPLKVKSLPRLELCAAHLLAKLWRTVKPLLPHFIKNVMFWSDSEIVLHWLQSHPSSLSTFVGNRISEIQEWTDARFWQHVPSKDNPADIVSRGSDVDGLTESIWFTGPSFLYLPPDKWPKNLHFDLTPELASLEKRKSKIAMVVTETVENGLIQFLNRFSSYTKILRVFAYVLRAIRKFKGKSFNQSQVTLSVKELNSSFLKIAELLQKYEFSDELKLIRKGLVPKSYIRSLSPFIQEYEKHGVSFNLLRVGGRLLNAPIKEDTKYPLLLGKGSHFVKVYLEHLHKTNSHAGPKMLVALMRERVWCGDITVVNRETRDERTLTLASVYMPYEAADPPGNEVLELTAYAKRRGAILVMGCDANAHDSQWGSADINKRELLTSGAVGGCCEKCQAPLAKNRRKRWTDSRRARYRSSERRGNAELPTTSTAVERPVRRGHLIIGSSIKALPDPSSTTGKLNCLKRFRALSCLKERFWSAWQTDYVLQQQQKVKWDKAEKNVEVGTVVTVHDDNLPPQTWLLGRVVAVETGTDGKSRVVQVKTKNGVFRRPIHKLAPLPVLDENELSC
ncbi:uncharacterized protein LOC135955564 [Calliphora vicina]|uniref:uncharacterized protein LOC135955564 n=1 Tax=Calliphora vicina TaxID=7373 RepID=UPI00325BB638